MSTWLIRLYQGRYSLLENSTMQGVHHNSMIKVYILFQGKSFLRGVISSSTNFLWKNNKDHNHYQEDEEVQSLNAIIYNPSIAERIKLYHASMFSPTLQTLAKYIDTG